MLVLWPGSLIGLAAIAAALLPEPRLSPRAKELWLAFLAAGALLWLAGWAARETENLLPGGRARGKVE